MINNPVADAYVREGTNAGLNFGTETFDQGQAEQHGEQQPAWATCASRWRDVGATVTSAKLRLYGVATTNTKNVGVHAVSNITWGETTITFSNAPAMTSPAIQTSPSPPPPPTSSGT